MCLRSLPLHQGSSSETHLYKVPNQNCTYIRVLLRDPLISGFPHQKAPIISICLKNPLHRVPHQNCTYIRVLLRALYIRSPSSEPPHITVCPRSLTLHQGPPLQPHLSSGCPLAVSPLHQGTPTEPPYIRVCLSSPQSIRVPIRAPITSS